MTIKYEELIIRATKHVDAGTSNTVQRAPEDYTQQKYLGLSPLSPQYAIFGRTKGGIFKSCPRVLKLWVFLLGRCLKVSLHQQIAAHVDGGPRSRLRKLNGVAR